MKSKLLFTHSYFYQLDSKQWKIKEPYPPLMTLVAASVMRELGYEVTLFDSCLSSNIQGFKTMIQNHHKYVVIFDDGFNYLTKMCLTSMREAAFEIQKEAKKHGATVIVCSSDATDHYEEYLREGADFVLKGEGEQSLAELIEALENGDNFSEINGIVFFDANGKLIINPKRNVVTDLDSLPRAAWDLIDFESYKIIWKQAKKEPYINIATTRGCPFKCNWCAKPIYGNRYNSRSPKLVVDEISMLVEEQGYTHFWMCDDIFGLKPGWVQEFRDELKSRKLSIRYKIQSRADLLLKEDTIDALVESGLDEVWIGAESGSQRILDSMDKGTTIAQIEESTRILRSKGVCVAFFIQYGYLGETMAEIKKTISMISRLLPDKIGISVSYPLPGTKYYNIVKSQMQEKVNWVDSDDLDLMFKNTYSSAFYKKLHRYTHNRHRIAKGFNTLKRIIGNPLSTTSSNLMDLLRMCYHSLLSVINLIHLVRYAKQ